MILYNDITFSTPPPYTKGLLPRQSQNAFKFKHKVKIYNLNSVIYFISFVIMQNLNIFFCFYVYMAA